MSEDESSFDTFLMQDFFLRPFWGWVGGLYDNGQLKLMKKYVVGRGLKYYDSEKGATMS